MATKTITEVFNEVAEAIQEKKKDYTPIKPANFGKEIEDLKSGGDLVKASTLTTPDVIIHLDKLKENLPEACLNRSLHYVGASSTYLGMNFSLTGEDSYSMYGLTLYLFGLNYYYPEWGNYTSFSRNDFYLELDTVYYDEQDHELINVYFYGADGNIEINNVAVFDGITVRELIDNIILANGSNILTIGRITSYGNTIYNYAEKINLHWYGMSSDSCRDLTEQATLTDLEDVVEFYKTQEI